MASPPNYSFPGGARSPPHLPSLTTSSLSKKRAADGGPSPNMKRRKGSVMSIGSAHPLRQTSFPPDEAPGAGGARSPSVDIDAMSYVSGAGQSVVSAAASAAPASAAPTGPPKKKRGRKSKAEKAREQTPSVVGGAGGGKPGTAPPSEVGGSTVGRGAKSAAGGKDQGGQGQDGDDDDEGPTEVAATADTLTKEQKEEEHRQRGMLINAFSADQFDRFENWRAANLSKAGVRRLINATISQSVTENVVIGMRAVAKVFIGDIIEGARHVQAEWIEKAGEKQTDLPSPPATPGAATSNNADSQGQTQTQSQGDSTQPNGENNGGDGAAEKGDESMPDASQQEKEKERDDRRGPLRPEHLREALRRYKMSFEGGGVGMQLIWHQQQQNGVDRFPTRTGGRRIFR
ncbi:hTAFII28-like protein conserved region-domain-containing protein [Sordaria brevicollis]|uniref:HTAFII28-like protein conserved region-domain-containing protein n=1 Tax=Sordaria brevicollis TaxID=83679 RepID=A0AAE0UG37_SORBR|nr:hTAFII28-like protein conserved region-domain-containing protein [Sordaria brevicollis]